MTEHLTAAYELIFKVPFSDIHIYTCTFVRKSHGHDATPGASPSVNTFFFICTHIQHCNIL